MHSHNPFASHPHLQHPNYFRPHLSGFHGHYQSGPSNISPGHAIIQPLHQLPYSQPFRSPFHHQASSAGQIQHLPHGGGGPRSHMVSEEAHPSTVVHKPEAASGSHGVPRADTAVEAAFPTSLRYKFPPVTPAVASRIARELVDNVHFSKAVLHVMSKMSLPPPFKETGGAGVPSGVVDDSEQPQKRRRIQPPSSQAKKASTSSAEGKGRQSTSFKSMPIRQEQRVGDAMAVEEEQCSVIETHRVEKKSVEGSQVDEDIESDEEEEEAGGEKSVVDVGAELRRKQLRGILRGKAAGARISTTHGRGMQAQQSTAIRLPGGAQVTTRTRRGLKPRASVAAQRAFYTVDELRQMKMDEKDVVEQVPQYRDYAAGPPTETLYVKNVSKDASVEDLARIFGGFARLPPGQAPTAAIATFAVSSVRFFTKGRLKGQAFITYSSIGDAAEALVATNRTSLHSKPLIVSFAKSSTHRAGGTDRGGAAEV